jgi:alpha-methylacyl-CoA racemase
MPPSDAGRDPAEATASGKAAGPLAGIRVIEVAGLGAGPYTAMMLADFGADVIRVDRPGTRTARPEKYALSRGRRSIIIDMKQPDGLAAFMTLAERADVLLEGFRPGVAERLGFGPDECLARNPRLVYGRMTGWGQQGPMSQMAGHDLNYLALTGALTLLQRRPGSRPVTPPGLLADFGGGGLMLAFGVVCGLLEARRSGTGQVIDAAMTDGVASLTTLIYSMTAQGRWVDQPGVNFCDGGSPYYDSYATSDGRYVVVAAIEPQFYAALLEKLGLSPTDLPDRDNKANWPRLKKLFADIFMTRSRDEWTELFDGSDACVTPVLTFSEAPGHPHNAARGTMVGAFGVTQPAPAPRFSRTPGAIAGPPPAPGAQSAEILLAWGFPAEKIDELLAAATVLGPGQ